jgi:hypothetical protein
VVVISIDHIPALVVQLRVDHGASHNVCRQFGVVVEMAEPTLEADSPCLLDSTDGSEPELSSRSLGFSSVAFGATASEYMKGIGPLTCTAFASKRTRTIGPDAINNLSKITLRQSNITGTKLPFSRSHHSDRMACRLWPRWTDAVDWQVLQTTDIIRLFDT